MNTTIMFSTGLLSLMGACLPDAGSPAAVKAVTPLSGRSFTLGCQVFESCDIEGATTDTVAHKGDFIFFSTSGKAYMYYKNRMDSLDYSMISSDSVTFGDTPFRISNTGNLYRLYQNEEEINGDFNRVTYYLTRQ